MGFRHYSPRRYCFKSKIETSFGETLQDLAYPKIFFAVRNDSGALYTDHPVHRQGILNLHLLEIATRAYRQTHRKAWTNASHGPSVCRGLSCATAKCKAHRARRLPWPTLVIRLDVRPLSPGLLAYAIYDVEYMHDLFTMLSRKYCKAMNMEVVRDIMEVSQQIAMESIMPEYKPDEEQQFYRCID